MYSLNKKGSFKCIPQKWVHKALGAVSIKLSLPDWDLPTIMEGYSQKGIHLGNRDWIPNYVSYSVKYNTYSFYWLSKDGQYLLRISDHWSEGARSKVTNCGKIASCFYALLGAKKAVATANSNFYPHKFYGGIIKLSDLKDY